MRRFLLWPWLAAWLLALPAWGSEDDIASPACRAALAALQAHEAAMTGAASAPAGPGRVPAARADAVWRSLRAQALRRRRMAGFRISGKSSWAS